MSEKDLNKDSVDIEASKIVDIRAPKPTTVELGLDPSTLIKVTPSLEVVMRADADAAKIMREKGIDPRTGMLLRDANFNRGVDDSGEQKSSTGTGGEDVVDETVENVALDFEKSVNSKPEKVKITVMDRLLALFMVKPLPKAGDIVVKNKKRGEKISNMESIAKKFKDKAGELKGKVDGKSGDKKGAKVPGGKKVTAAEQKKYAEAERIFQDGLATVKDLISPASLEINYDTLHIDGVYTRSFYAFAYPRYLDANWLSPIVNFDVTMDISQFIYPIDSGEIMRVLKKKVAQMQSSTRMLAEKGHVSDVGLQTALEDAEALRVSIQRGEEKFFQFALYFTLYAKDMEKLDTLSKQIESLLAGKLIMTKRTQLQAKQGFDSTSPICMDELDVIRNMNTSPLSTTFPFTSSDLTSDRGILYGLNRHNDSLVIFDRFALENANSVVFAKSGSGKSYAVKLEILRLMMMGTDVIVIDPENEYEDLANMVGGSYLNLSLNSDRRINPFDLPIPIDGAESKTGDLVRSNVITLMGLLRLMLGGLTPVEEGILDKALLDVYSLKGITLDVDNPGSYEPPTMEDLQKILDSMDGAEALVQRLSKYTTGSFSGIFNQLTNVDLSSGFMVFCIRDLEDELRPVATYILLNYIWNRVRSELKKRVLVVDEAWSLMQHEDSAKFLFGLVKRARKYYLGVTTITQDVDDFIKSDYGKPIITNSSMQLLLKQAPSAAETLTKVFNLTEGEKYILLNSNVGQGLFFAGMQHVAIQVIASYEEDKVVSTSPADK